jgi:hypothetical protein
MNLIKTNLSKISEISIALQKATTESIKLKTSAVEANVEAATVKIELDTLTTSAN